MNVDGVKVTFIINGRIKLCSSTYLSLYISQLKILNSFLMAGRPANSFFLTRSLVMAL